MAGAAAAAIVLMCKAPRPGFAKTRLAGAIGDDAAARLAAAFIRDSAARAAALAAACDAQAVALHAPDDAGEEIASLLPPRFVCMPQGPGDVGERMARGFSTLFAAGHGPVLITGSDVPTMPVALLREAFLSVRDGHADAAIVPVRDGGYCAIALARPAPALFLGIAWSTPDVMAATAAAAERAGLRLHRTAGWYDVDEVADLATLRAELGGEQPAGCAIMAGDPAPATRAELGG